MEAFKKIWSVLWIWIAVILIYSAVYVFLDGCNCSIPQADWFIAGLLFVSSILVSYFSGRADS